MILADAKLCSCRSRGRVLKIDSYIRLVYADCSCDAKLIVKINGMFFRNRRRIYNTEILYTDIKYCFYSVTKRNQQFASLGALGLLLCNDNIYPPCPGMWLRCPKYIELLSELELLTLLA